MQKLRKYLLLAALSAIAICVIAGLKYGLTPELRGAYVSPRKVYRVEYYTASPLQRIWHLNMKSPSFVRLYRINPEILMAESEIVDMWLNGELYWYLNPPMNTIQVGNDIAFENIPPECTNCPLLTDKEIMP